MTPRVTATPKQQNDIYNIFYILETCVLQIINRLGIDLDALALYQRLRVREDSENHVFYCTLFFENHPSEIQQNLKNYH